MSLSRLLLPLLFASSFASAQEQAVSTREASHRNDTAARRISDSSLAFVNPDPGALLRAEEITILGQPAKRRDLTLSRPDDEICYTLRTYVVARDDKESDSTHRVSSSTCQPGSRYRLKTADTEGNDKR